MLLDGGLTHGFTQTGSLLLAVGWLLGLAAVAVLLFRSTTTTAHRPAVI